MVSLKTWCVAFTIAASNLLGCTHSANLPSQFTLHGGATLQSHHWQLQHAFTPQGDADAQWQLPNLQNHTSRTVGLRFADNQTLSVDRLCNTMSGSYEIRGELMKVSRLVATMMACNDAALRKMEHNVSQQLAKVHSWKISGDSTPILELKFDSGASWHFRGIPTHETLYGNSERIFLEVAPHRVTCNQPSGITAQCLQVREIKFNNQGIKQSIGTWSNYPGSIEGYVHQAGVRNVLRIKRFTDRKNLAGEPKHIDVLDLVVESEIVL